MSLIAKAQALQHKRMEALRKYAEDVTDIERRRHELDLALVRAWVNVVNAGWAKSDLTGLGLQAPKTPRTRRPEPTSDDEAEQASISTDRLHDGGGSDG